ncbi:MAG TPA: hypothetical protein PKZ53_26475, partial [Acidobacteriota bacterium]|nr:hypothetical protein [Acidobacteriota bacterium]
MCSLNISVVSLEGKSDRRSPGSIGDGGPRMVIQGFKIRRLMRGEDASAWVRSLEAGDWLG